MIHRGTYDGTIYHNPANKFCIISVKTADKDVPEEARSTRRHKDHLIRFVATGYELPRTDAVELELDGEWKKGKYGMQLQVEQWHEIVPQTKSGVEGYLASGLIKGIGPALAKQIVSRFGVETLDILQNRPERLLEIKGITENKLEAIKTSYAESRMLQDLMTLLSPFKITPKTAQKIYQFFGPASVDILKKSPFELCQISGFGFLRVDAIVQKNGGDLRAPMRIKGALFWALEDTEECRKRTPVCCSIRLRRNDMGIKLLSMRSIGIRSGTECTQTDKPRFVMLLFSIWSIIRNTLGPTRRPLPRRGAVLHATSR